MTPPESPAIDLDELDLLRKLSNDPEYDVTDAGDTYQAMLLAAAPELLRRARERDEWKARWRGEAQARDEEQAITWKARALTAERERDELREALAFYADPDTYFAIAFLADRPCGPFVDDADGEHDGKPGARARAALADSRGTK